MWSTFFSVWSTFHALKIRDLINDHVTEPYYQGTLSRTPAEVTSVRRGKKIDLLIRQHDVVLSYLPSQSDHEDTASDTMMLLNNTMLTRLQNATVTPDECDTYHFEQKGGGIATAKWPVNSEFGRDEMRLGHDNKNRATVCRPAPTMQAASREQ